MRAKVNTGVALGGIALAGAIVVFGVAVTGALLPEAGAAPPATAVTGADAPAPGYAEAPGLFDPEESPIPTRWSEAVPAEVLSMAVERAPFDPDRQASGQRYLLPGERVAAAPREERRPPERPAPPEFQILGTVASPTGGVAVVRLAGGPARVMAIGDEIEGYRVSAIESGAVMMSGQGWDLTFAVADPQPNAATLMKEENAREIEVARARQADGARRAAQQMEALVERLRLNGNASVDINNGRAVIVGPDGQRREIVLPVPPAPVSVELEKLRMQARPRGGGQ